MEGTPIIVHSAGVYPLEKKKHEKVSLTVLENRAKREQAKAYQGS